MLGKPTIPKGGRRQRQPRSARQMDMFTALAVDAAARLPRWTDLPQNAQAALIRPPGLSPKPEGQGVSGQSRPLFGAGAYGAALRKYRKKPTMADHRRRLL